MLRSLSRRISTAEAQGIDTRSAAIVAAQTSMARGALGTFPPWTGWVEPTPGLSRCQCQIGLSVSACRHGAGRTWPAPRSAASGDALAVVGERVEAGVDAGRVG